MASFFKENQLIQTEKKRKKSLDENSWFEEPKCNLKSKVVNFFVFLFLFTVLKKIFGAQILQECKTCYELIGYCMEDML
jgi:hypothetical protein